MKGLKFLITLLLTGNLLSTLIFAQSSEMAGRDNFQAQQRALIVRIEQQESRLAALEKEIGSLRSQVALQAKVPTPAAPKAIDLRPSAPSMVPSQPSESLQTYTVRTGDNLVAIARLHEVSVADLMRENDLSSDRIQIGDQLVIPTRGGAMADATPTPTPVPTPAPTQPAPPVTPAATSVAGATSVADATYTIATGDTIARVARIHGVSIEEVVAANGLRNPNQIAVGQQIVIPSQASAVQPTDSVAAQPPLNRTEPVASSTPKQAAPKTSAAPEPTPDNPFPTGYAYYTVVSGDSLYSIAELFGTTQKELEELNAMNAGGMIHPDQQIVVPMANYKGPFVSN